jgi:hypothetical protein
MRSRFGRSAAWMLHRRGGVCNTCSASRQGYLSWKIIDYHGPGSDSIYHSLTQFLQCESEDVLRRPGGAQLEGIVGLYTGIYILSRLEKLEVGPVAMLAVRSGERASGVMVDETQRTLFVSMRRTTRLAKRKR